MPKTKAHCTFLINCIRTFNQRTFFIAEAHLQTVHCALPTSGGHYIYWASNLLLPNIKCVRKINEHLSTPAISSPRFGDLGVQLNVLMWTWICIQTLCFLPRFTYIICVCIVATHPERSRCIVFWFVYYVCRDSHVFCIWFYLNKYGCLFITECTSILIQDENLRLKI